MTPEAFVAALDDRATGAVPAAAFGVSPVGLRPSLRHTKRIGPQPSHKHWYRNRCAANHASCGNRQSEVSVSHCDEALAGGRRELVTDSLCHHCGKDE